MCLKVKTLSCVTSPEGGASGWSSVEEPVVLTTNKPQGGKRQQSLWWTSF